MLSGVFGGQADTTLTDIRGVIDQAVREKGARAVFPAEEISRKVRERGRQVYEREDVERIVDETQYGSAEAFIVLALIYPHLDFHYSIFDIDHMHPKSSFTKREMLAKGVPEKDVEFCIAHFNFLPNLQLLAGPVNEAKKRKPFADWLAEQHNADWYRETSFIPKVSLALGNFREFYDRRRTLLVEALMRRLGLPSPDQNRGDVELDATERGDEH